MASLRFALSLQRLRELEMAGMTFCPVVLPTETLELEDGTCAPLIVFRYKAILTPDRRPERRALRGEGCLVSSWNMSITPSLRLHSPANTSRSFSYPATTGLTCAN